MARRALIGLVLAVAAIGVAPFAYLVYRSVSCPEQYDAMVNDFCGWSPPSESQLPIIDGWELDATELSCGSGGCPYRAWALSSDTAATTTGFMQGLRRRGWTVQGQRASNGDLCLRVYGPEDDRWSLYDIDRDPGTDSILVVGNLVADGRESTERQSAPAVPLIDQCHLS